MLSVKYCLLKVINVRNMDNPKAYGRWATLRNVLLMVCNDMDMKEKNDTAITVRFSLLSLCSKVGNNTVSLRFNHLVVTLKR